MGFRFRKSVKVLPGVRLNFGKRGFTSTTIGGKFFKTNVSNRGVRHTFSLPGTGISYQSKIYRNEPANHDFGENDIDLYWYCASCYFPNSHTSKFCDKCGGVYVPNPQQQIAHEADYGSKILIAVGSMVGLFGITAVVLIVALGGSTPQKTAPNVDSYSTVKPSPDIPIPQTTSNSELPVPGKSVKANPSAAARHAVVIAENANLRQVANPTGPVIRTIPERTGVEVVKQRGAWFLVNADNQAGWIHGNTIQYVDGQNLTRNGVTNDLDESTYDSSPYNSPPVKSYSGSHYSTPRKSYSRLQGSSYGHGSVRVRSYFRKDGTFVRSHTRRSRR